PIITADQRMAERRGIKACIFGKSGIGKTTLLWALDPAMAPLADAMNFNKFSINSNRNKQEVL
ncbi:MAG: hypothetical protein HQL63_14100, partial [Magnetococcales bacterium]|nr:hypothetical protein [Magnetococcales bacterium]